MSKNKMTLLAVKEILKETDENHPVTAKQICDILENEYNLTAERRAVGRDIKLLAQSGMDIVYCPDNRKGCYLKTRLFDNWELKVLVDSVSQAKFLSKDVSSELVEKLLHTTSKHIEKTLSFATPKPDKKDNANKLTQYNIAFILNAIEENNMICFKYGSLNKKLKLEPRNNGKKYVVNPYMLTWKEDVYYLICNYDGKEGLAYYRLDRIMDIAAVKQGISSPREILGDDWERKMDDFVKGTVRHYSGKDKVMLVLNVKEQMINYLYDEFGRSIIRIEEKADKSFDVYIDTADSQGLYFLLLQYGANLEVIEPKEVRAKYIAAVESIMNKYK